MAYPALCVERRKTIKKISFLGVLLLLACSPDPQVETVTTPAPPQIAGEILIETMVDQSSNQITEEYQYYIHEKGHQVRHGFYRSYHPDGNLLETGHFKFGRKEGEWTYHQGDLKRLGTFADDHLVGVYSYYDSSGRKIREGT
jgi:hypothetical protein